MTVPPFFGAYSASKHALEGYTEGLRYEVRPFNIRVALIEPGYFKTNLAQTIDTPEQPVEVYEARRQQAAGLDRLGMDYGRDPILVAHKIAHILPADAPPALHGGTRRPGHDHR